MPGRARTSFTVPSCSERTVVSIFMASRVKRTSPRASVCFTRAATVPIVPGMGAPTCLGLPGSTLRGGGGFATWLRSVRATAAVDR